MSFFIIMSKKDADSDWEADFSRRYDDPVEASDYAKSRNASNIRWGYDPRYKIRKVVDTDDDNFFTREAAKGFEVPNWDLEVLSYPSDYPHHLAHIDPSERKNIRFFRRLEDAIECKYTTVKISRYMINWMGFDEDYVTEFLVEYGFYNDIVMGITQDRDLIIKIYENGPSSCMNDPDEYEMPDLHPAVVYSEGDLALAYAGDEDSYSARAVVWPEKKIFMNIYGHYELLKKYLVDLGYKETFKSSEFKGARVAAIYDEDERAYYMPYLDMAEYCKLSDCGKFMILVDNDDPDENSRWFESRYTTGYANEIED